MVTITTANPAGRAPAPAPTPAAAPATPPAAAGPRAALAAATTATAISQIATDRNSLGANLADIQSKITYYQNIKTAQQNKTLTQNERDAHADAIKYLDSLNLPDLTIQFNTQKTSFDNLQTAPTQAQITAIQNAINPLSAKLLPSASLQAKLAAFKAFLPATTAPAATAPAPAGSTRR